MISETKNVTKKMLGDTKELNVGQTTRSNPGKFSAVLDDAQKEKKLNDARAKALESEEVVSMKITDPSNRPPQNKLDE